VPGVVGAVLSLSESDEPDLVVESP
jgi:hypothetical protein